MEISGMTTIPTLGISHSAQPLSRHSEAGFGVGQFVSANGRKPTVPKTRSIWIGIRFDFPLLCLKATPFMHGARWRCCPHDGWSCFVTVWEIHIINRNREQ